jgi:hypothetical protein
MAQQAASLDGLLLDALALLQDGWSPAEVDVGGGEVAQCLTLNSPGTGEAPK